MLDLEYPQCLWHFNASHYMEYCIRMASLLKLNYSSRLELDYDTAQLAQKDETL